MFNQVINVFKDEDFHSLSGQSVQVFDHISNIYVTIYIYIFIYSRLNRISCVSVYMIRQCVYLSPRLPVPSFICFMPYV